MSAIMDNFSTILPYLDGSSFHENLPISYSLQSNVQFRTEVLVDLCRGKRVLHVGCCDHAPLIAEKIARREWLHGLLTEVSEMTLGVDIDAAAVSAAREISGLDNLMMCDITATPASKAILDLDFDIAVFGEVVEHIPNPAHFLKTFRENYGSVFRDIVITVPNAFRGGNIRGIFKNIETINTDHRFFFTPYTIAKIATDAGFKPREIRMATFTKPGRIKTMLLNRKPLLAEDIIFIGSH